MYKAIRLKLKRIALIYIKIKHLNQRLKYVYYLIKQIAIIISPSITR